MHNLFVIIAAESARCCCYCFSCWFSAKHYSKAKTTNSKAQLNEIFTHHLAHCLLLIKYGSLVGRSSRIKCDTGLASSIFNLLGQ